MRAVHQPRCGATAATFVVLFSLVALLAPSGAAGVPLPAARVSAPVSLWVRGTEGTGDGQFRGPVGIAVGTGGVYVADHGNNRVEVFTESGDFVKQIGEPGNEAGQFVSIRRLTVGSYGDLYVSEDNGRIQKFPTDGRVRLWGSSGSLDGQFDQAYGIAVDPASGLHLRRGHQSQPGSEVRPVG